MSAAQLFDLGRILLLFWADMMPYGWAILPGLDTEAVLVV